jgi:hypothetical protein
MPATEGERTIRIECRTGIVPACAGSVTGYRNSALRVGNLSLISKPGHRMRHGR